MHKGLWPTIGLGIVLALIIGAVLIAAWPAWAREDLRSAINFGNPFFLLFIVFGVAVIIYAWFETRGR